MATCFICLDETLDVSSMKRLCTTCQGSTVCGKCESAAAMSNNPDVLCVCPICRRFLGYGNLKIRLVSIWHPFTLLLWAFKTTSIPFWQQSIISYLSYKYISETCKTINETVDNNRPSLLLKRWTIFNSIIHIPYFAYVLYREGLSDDSLLNTYITAHIWGPGLMFIVFKILYRALSQN